MTQSLNLKSLQSMMSVTKKNLVAFTADLATAQTAIAALEAKTDRTDEENTALTTANEKTIPTLNEKIARANNKLGELAQQIAAAKPEKTEPAATKFVVQFSSKLGWEQLKAKLEKLGATDVIFNEGHFEPAVDAAADEVAPAEETTPAAE